MQDENIILSIPKTVFNKIKKKALKNNKTINEFILQLLSMQIQSDSSYDRAMKRQINLMKKGFNLTDSKGVSIKRENIYE